MRAHGVPNFPDPRAGGGFSVESSPGSSTLTVDGITFDGRPAFESAITTCKFFGGGTAPPPISAAEQRAMIAGPPAGGGVAAIHELAGARSAGA
jgi:hypothetical protein